MAVTTDAYVSDFAEFIRASPSSYHAASEVARRLEAAGFTRLDERDAWPTGPGGRVVVRDGAVIAWVQPAGASASTPFRILGAHTDSPGFKLKPNPSSEAAGLSQANVEVYGGPLLSSWLDRELELAGRLVTLDGAEHLVRTGPMLRIPQLAIHLDREANKGLTLDRQRHVQPIWAAGEPGDVVALLAERAGVALADVAGHDVLTAATTPPERFGRDDVFFAAGRMDNLSSVYAGLAGLLATHEGQTDASRPADASRQADASGPAQLPVLAAFDHEELGSESRSGAAGPFLEDVLSRVAAGLGANDEERRRAFASSWLLSSDAGHAVHPNYPEKHDPVNRPVLGGGPLLKLNANQRYASDAVGSALWERVCRAAGGTTQPFVSNNAIPCGSTIGPISATRLGIRTVDVGVPLLSMHSARELAHVDDLAALGRAVEAFFRGV
ncbi:M18 family aminopeptidase [Agromyces aerolatus]|uniref:M18 family aminopeptidase n=1 Tax=Agromyces sp. LY-1074 TaxID=3074080 RepID=UPI002855560E|nr:MULTISPECIES: M18 family aminopeptidase [unclassified Agromyces]MDR5698781.1 M18 family aminopeptidase [Agromyces sp. LY-1074]MDR5705441.1 M18 family aminopeptidase [Agromyces sp. LY-1358]